MLSVRDILFAICLGAILLPIWFQIRRPLPQSPARSLSPDPVLPPLPKFHDIKTPYDENEIVGLIVELYELLVKLAYFSRDDIIWSSDDRHKINESLCKELHLDDAVISLMKKIPYKSDEFRHSFELFPHSMPYSFLNDDEIIASRDPERMLPLPGRKSELRMDYMPSHDVALSENNEEDGLPVVLDTKNNTVRLIPWEWSLEGLRIVKMERPDYPLHYRNLPAQHAPSYFLDLIEKIKSLEIIPSASDQFGREYHGPKDARVRDEIRRILIEEYDWGDNFRQADWLRDAEKVWDRVIRGVEVH